MQCEDSSGSQGSEIKPHTSGNKSLLYDDGTVCVRHLRDTQEDAEFAGKMKVEAFREKYEHATSRASIVDCIKTSTVEHRGQDGWFYERHLVAEYNKQLAGIIVVIFEEDPNPFYEDSDLQQFGCTDICGILCLAKAHRVTVGESQCYLQHICIDEHFRGKGVGKVLLDLAEKEAQTHGCKEMFAWVSGEKAKEFFTKQNYTFDVTKFCCIWCSTGKWKLQKMVKRLDRKME